MIPIYVTSHHIIILKLERKSLLCVGQTAPEISDVGHIFHIGAEVAGAQIVDHILHIRDLIPVSSGIVL